MIFQSIQVYNIIILSVSSIILVLFMVFSFYKISGLIINLSALIVYLVSIITKNIFFQFLGISILFIFYLIVIYYIFIIFIYKKKSISFNSFHNSAIYPFEDAVITIHGEDLPLSFPGIFNLISFNIYENGNLIEKRIVPVVNVGDGSIEINMTFNRHGLFSLKDFYFIFSDIFGLTRYKISTAAEHSIRIFPFFSESVKIPFFLDKGGEEILQSVIKVDSTDFYENRKYYPGDDTRRINWKIFAHSGELHIREVEKIPPKIGQISLLFAPYSDNIYEYEYVSSLFLATVYYLLSYGFQLKIYSPASVNCVTIDKSKEKDFNFIIDFSYREFNHAHKETLDGLVIFSSFFEYKKLLKNFRIKKSYSAVSYFNSRYVPEDIFKAVFMVNKHDNFLVEVNSIKKEINNNKKTDKELEEVESISKSRKIELSLYRADNGF